MFQQNLPPPYQTCVFKNFAGIDGERGSSSAPAEYHIVYQKLILKEYEKVVIFRLGRFLTGVARGPGVFFIIPCVDIYEVIDMRVQNL